MAKRTREVRLGGGEHTALVLTALGAIAAGDRMENLLGCESEGEKLAADDPAVLAALGLLSLQRSLRRWLELAAVPPADATVDPGSTPPRDLLR